MSTCWWEAASKDEQPLGTSRETRKQSETQNKVKSSISRNKNVSCLSSRPFMVLCSDMISCHVVLVGKKWLFFPQLSCLCGIDTKRSTDDSSNPVYQRLWGEESASWGVPGHLVQFQCRFQCVLGDEPQALRPNFSASSIFFYKCVLLI